MQKKLFSLLLVLMMLLSLSIPAFAAEETGELIVNGGFEAQKSDGKPTGWTLSGGEMGKEFGLRTEEGHGGVLDMAAAGNVFVSQIIDGLVPGTEYTITAKVYVTEQNLTTPDAGPTIKVEQREVKEDGTAPAVKEISKSFQELKTKRWENVSFSFVTEQNVTRATILVRLLRGGRITWDDVSVVGKTTKGLPEQPEKTEINKTDATGSKEETVETENLVAIAEGNMLSNHSFEALKETGEPMGWGLSGATLGRDFFVATEDVPDGKNAIQMTGTSKFMSQVVDGLIPGEAYTIKAQLKVTEQTGQGATIKIEQRKPAGGATYMSVKESAKSFTDAKRGEWQEQTYEFVAEPGVTRVTILVRLLDGGDIYWDNVQLLGKSTKALPGEIQGVTLQSVESAGMKEYKAPAPNCTELLVNGSLEDLKASTTPVPQGWEYSSPDYVSLETESVHGGKNAVKLTASEEKKNPFIKQTVQLPFENAEYQISAWVRNVDVTPTGIHSVVTFKIEFYNSPEPSSETWMPADINMLAFTPITGSEWIRFVDHIRAPEGAVSMRLYARLYGTGTCYWDDLSCYVTELPATHAVVADQTFYYTDVETGEAEVSANLKAYDNIAVGSVNFSILDGETVLASENGVPVADGKAKWTFRTASLPETAKPYTLRTVLYDNSDTARDTVDTRIYRYDRPKRIAKDGTYMLDGKPFHPVFAYHTDPEDFQYLSEIGINLTQMYLYRSVEGYKKVLDDALKYPGLMVMVPLYLDMKPGFHPDNAAFMTEVIKATKDYPNVFAYMVMDEPYNNPNNVLQYLEDTYTSIRALTDEIPVYILETGKDHFANVIRYGDIFCGDPYPAGENTTTKNSNDMRVAMEAAKYGKCILHLAQAFDWLGWAPTGEEIVHQQLQAFFEGVNGVGYFSISDSFKDAEGNNLPIFKTERWPILQDFYDSGILADMISAFSSLEYKTFYDSRTDDAYVRTYIKDGSLYTVVLNCSETEDITVEVPMVSPYGITVSDFSAEAVYGQKFASESHSGNTLTATVAKKGYAIYKITPTEAVDFSPVPDAVYKDTAFYPWAREAIDAMTAKGVLTGVTERSFAPGQKITRGDFAAFLIRTLGLTSDSTTLFADVMPTDSFAKEIAIGKNLGILKGVGDDKFLPFAEISRQDMMVIAARGMRLKKALDEGSPTEFLQSFSDNALIADYAVADIAAMVRAGIVQGNADGTVNPKGNTTRAEAAVIMYRIENWSAQP
ncbi:MAG: hypothetical protein E7408_04260 [Ruminococcaceae bacterium]|nr:hypothetical protein [Oscillospiraceae bacterium]